MSLLSAIETCLRLTNTPPSRFGRDSVRDPRLVHDLRRGRQPGAAVERRVRAHIMAMIERLPDSHGKCTALRRAGGPPPRPESARRAGPIA
jgi:hypothetical protein